MKERAFITGISGFVGSHLAEHLVESGMEVSGTCRYRSGLEEIKHFKKVRLWDVDFADCERGAITALVSRVKPDFIFHLAAQSSPKKSFIIPEETFTTNVISQIKLLEAVKEARIKPRVLVVGSADEYGKVKEEDNPVDEETPLQPRSPYAVSKVAQDLFRIYYTEGRDMDIVTVRPFNHIGARQRLGFVVPDFAEQVAKIEKRKAKPVIKVGDLSPIRDFTDVTDMVRAYRLAVLKGKKGEVYNIGSGKGVSIQEVLNKFLSFAKKEIRVEVDPTLIRPADIPKLVCNSDKFRKVTGWEPYVKLSQSLRHIFDYWLSRV